MAFKNKSGICILGILLASGISTNAFSANSLSPAETAAGGWELLFNGTTVDQWTVNNDKKWTIDDSAMKSPNTGEMLYSTKTFSNFEWRVDFKVGAQGNSGFFIRTKATDWYCDGFEVAVLDSKAGGDNGVDGQNRSNKANGDTLTKSVLDPVTGKPFQIGGYVPIKRTGAIYDMYPPTKDGILIKDGGIWVDRMNPAMVWNSMVIWANGKNIETWLNGMKITDFVIGSPEYVKRYMGSKFSPGCGDQTKVPADPLFGNKNTTGKLVIQDHGAGLDVWVRNNKIRPINTSAALPKPQITPDGGNFSGSAKVTLDAGMTAYIHYTLDGSDPTASSPLYNDSTGIILSKPGATTLLAKTFRPGFTTSAVSSATFTLPGTSVLPNRISNPEVETFFNGGTLIVQNRNGDSFTLDIVSVNGQKAMTLPISKSTTDIALSGLEPGVYLVKLHAGEWHTASKIFLQ